MEDHNPFIIINFRGKKKYIRKDLIEMVPYLYNLLNSPLQGNARDDEGNLIVDEDSYVFFSLVDHYRCWLEKGRPTRSLNIFGHKTVEPLYSSVARRMGFETEFIDSILSKLPIDEEDLFNCYYCGKTYAHGERITEKPCEYHHENCDCKSSISSRKCGRVPFHTPIPIKIAKRIKQV